MTCRDTGFPGRPKTAFPPSATPSQNGFPGRIYLVKGNNDGDPLAVSRTIPQECPQVKEFGGFIIVDFDEFRVAMTHYPENARAHAMAGDFDMVFYGHTHDFSEKMVGETLLLNPGDVMGLKDDPSFCLVESDTKKVQRLYLYKMKYLLAPRNSTCRGSY